MVVTMPTLPTLMRAPWKNGSAARSRSKTESKKESDTVTEGELKFGARSSQAAYAEKTQTLVIYDWDDTLFPTNFLLNSLEVNWRLPLARQPNWRPSEINHAVKEVSKCETEALEVLQRAVKRGHVVIVTLARQDWVEQSCMLYYNRVGAFLQRHDIPVIYARESMPSAEQEMVKLSHGESRSLYAIMKAHAMRDAAQKFYSQYPGQTWKNVLCFGDSMFEHHGLLAASNAYMQGHATGLSSALTNIGPRSPDQRGALEQVAEHRHVKRLRVKRCKLVEAPTPYELFIQLKKLHAWLDFMVDLDDGFDLDFESVGDAGKLAAAESVLRGQQPISILRDLGITGEFDDSS